MGLAERRIATDFQTNHYPALKKKIDDAAGFDVPMEVRWNTLADADPRYVKGWTDGWPKVYFAPIIEAFKLIARDQMGKDALRGGIKQIVVQNTKSSYSSDWAKFEPANGVLTLDCQYANVDSIKDRTDVLVKELEKSL